MDTNGHEFHHKTNKMPRRRADNISKDFHGETKR